MDQLKKFDRHDPSAGENFAPFMETLFGTDWQASNSLSLLGRGDWGGRYRCDMCGKDPEGVDQLMQHVQSRDHIRLLSYRLDG
eukprot:11412465-Prorocentrum_lima.AAC.1